MVRRVYTGLRFVSQWDCRFPDTSLGHGGGDWVTRIISELDGGKKKVKH